MATERFNVTAESLLVGLLKDAQSDVSYDNVLPLYEAWQSEMQSTPHPEKLQLRFIQLIRNSPQFAPCLKEKNLTLLGDIVLQELPGALAGNARELLSDIGNPELFRHDTTKKLWKRIKKLVIACGLHDFVYGEPRTEADETRASKHDVKETETGQVKVARIQRFNHGYRAFLEQLATAFPCASNGDGGTDENDKNKQALLQAFDKRIEEKPDSVLEEYKKHVLPNIPAIATAIHENRTKEGVFEALDQYFGPSDNTWFKRLPLVQDLLADGVDKHWKTQMSKENEEAVKHPLMRAVGDLAVCMSGLDTLLYSPIVAALRKKVVEIMQREKMTAETLLPTSEQFNRAGMLNMVMELINEIPAATGNKISGDDIQTLLTNTLSGKDEVPASFSEVFSPDMIDFDCLEIVQDMPGIGDALAPVLAGMEGQLKGGTGKAAFGECVDKPAWIDRN